MNEDNQTLEDNKTTPDFWRKWIRIAKKRSEKHRAWARRAYDEYECERESSNSYIVEPLRKDYDESYPIYWAVVKQLESALYSQTPNLVGKREFGIEDQTALTASLIVERLGKYQVKQCDFKGVMKAIISDYIHADKATDQLDYQTDKEFEKLPATPTPEGGFVDASGVPIEEEIFQAQDGSFFYHGPNEVVVDGTQKIIVKPCEYNQILHCPDARSEDEIKIKAYKFCMTESEARKRFDIDDKFITWKHVKDEDDEKESGHKNYESTQKYLEGWECWCIENKKVYWYTEQYTDLLDIKDDPYQLEGFFPSPRFLISSKPSEDMFPRPAFIKLFSLINLMHTIECRLPPLIDAIRRRAIVDGSEDLVMALNQLDETDFVTAKGIQTILEKGGLQNMMFFLPVQEFVSALGELMQVQDRFEQKFYELFGMPDILRGISNPNDAVETVQRQSAAGNNRFRIMKSDIEEIARDSIEMQVDLALQVYSDQRIALITGYEYMSEVDKQNFIPALQMLRNDEMRLVRLEIETDSMCFADEQVEAQKMQYVSEIVTRGMNEITQIMQINPQLAVIPLQIMLMTLEHIHPGRALMDDIRSQIEQMIEQAKQQAENPPPPPPDYEHMKIQIKDKELQLKNNELILKGQIAAADNQHESVKAMLQQQKQEQDYYVEQMKLQLDGVEKNQQQQQLNLEQMTQQFFMQIEAMRVQIEQLKAQGQQEERMQEESRLQQQVDQEGQIGLIEALKPPTQEKQEATPVTIVNAPNTSPTNVNLGNQPESDLPIIPVDPLLPEDY